MNSKVAEKRMQNKSACMMFTVVTVILFIAYLVQFLQGTKSIGVMALLIVTDLAPMIAAWIVYKTNEESEYIRHIMGIGYGLFYLCACFTTDEQMVFTYAIPMIIVVTIFNDYKFSITISIGVAVISLCHAFRFAAMNEWSPEAVAGLEIETIVMICIAVFSVLTNRVTVSLNEKKMKEIDEGTEKTQALIDSIMEISGDVISAISDVADKMTMLSASSEETLASMQEVQSGTNDSAESVQTQLYKTEEIRTQVDNVSKASESIGADVVETVEACHEGRDNMATLMKQTTISEEAGNRVMKEVEELQNSTAQMQSIVELIKSVATQTSLLALNASIEAARAGEAGRGFAVVATEISNLAGQTTSATGSISELIEGISSEMTEVVNAINSLVESNKVQNEAAVVSQESFEKIIENIRHIRSNSQDLSQIVVKLVSANNEIVESIQTISAITEEVSAHSNTTCEATRQNQVIVEEVINLVEQMNNNAEKLKTLR